MRTISQLRMAGIERLKQVSETPALDVDILLAEVLGYTPVELILKAGESVKADADSLFNDWVNRREGQEPIAYIVKRKSFMGHDLYVDQRVLIPRPDTEILVEGILERLSQDSKMKMLDIGTGSGAILLSLIMRHRQCIGVGVDLSASALEVAGLNGQLMGLSAKISWIESDLYSAVMDRDFDWIISNPPYINKKDMGNLSANVIGFEPYGALYGGEDGLDFYRRIIDGAPQYLKPGGFIGLEIGYDQREAVSNLLEDAGFEGITCYNDLAGHNRAIIARLKPNRG